MRTLGALLLTAVVSVADATQDETTPISSGDPLVDEVAARLVAVIDPPEDYLWPPIFRIVEIDRVNANARLTYSEDSDLPQPVITLYRGILDDVIQGNADRLAMLLGHELAHIVCGHCDSYHESTPFVEHEVIRTQEYEADNVGLKIALRADFSLEGCLSEYEQYERLGMEYTSFDGLRSQQPRCHARLAFIDPENPEFWRTTSAWRTGVQFLMFEQYFAAEMCFRRVVREFPGAAEAWANLGYAQLMQYCDGLDADDLRNYDLGPLVVGGFYLRPESIIDARGDEDLWFDAAGALREALRLDPNSLLAAANLGVAYLVHPGGKDVGQSLRYFEIAADLAETQEEMLAEVRAAVLANAAVAAVNAGDLDQAEAHFKQARTLAARSESTLALVGGTVLYHQATVLARSGDVDRQQRAVGLFEKYLSSIGQTSAWWTLAYEQYVEVCGALGEEPQARDDFASSRKRRSYRPVTVVSLGDDETLTLLESDDVVEALLGEGQRVSVGRRMPFDRLRFEEQGLDLIVTDLVLAICLSDPNGPAIELREAGAATEVYELRVGMTTAEVEELLGDQLWDFRQLYDPDVNYKFYRDLGIALRLEGGELVELIVAQIPERRVQ